MQRPDDTRKGLGVRTLVPFFLLSFAMTWGIAALLILFPEQLAAIFGELSYTNPLYILAVYAPGIVGILLVVRYHGFHGLGRYFRRLTMWRMPAIWWAFLIIGIPVLFYMGAAIKGTITDPLPFETWTAVFPALLTALFIGPIEEFGWHGVGLPLLQRKFAPIWAGLILGAIWAFWHLPAFMLSGTPQSNWSLPAFFVGVVALSVILTPISNAARGSLLVAVLFHFQANGPVWPDAQPWDTLVFATAAVIVVWLNRKTMFSREGAATDVLAPASAAKSPRHRSLSPNVTSAPIEANP